MAVGMIGMSVSDFCGLTPEEFGKITEAWHSIREEQWEQVRTLAAFSIAPWNSKNKKITDLMPLPWDKSVEEDPNKELSEEEKRRRFEEALKNRGLKNGNIGGAGQD